MNWSQKIEGLVFCRLPYSRHCRGYDYLCRYIPMKAILSLILFLYAGPVSAQITYEQVEVQYDSVWEYKNLRVIPIRSKGSTGDKEIVSLSKAIRNGWVTVTERGTASTENVHWVRINNHSEHPVFISSGEMVAGGRQDRMLAKDTVLIPTGGDQYVPAMCIEEGRWSEKEKKFVYGGYGNPALRKVLDLSRNQVLIWKEVYGQLESGLVKSPTIAYGSKRADKKYLAEEINYFQYFLHRLRNTDSTLVGIVCMSGSRILGTDIFAGNNIFYDEVEALLGGYIEQAHYQGSVPSVPEETLRAYMDLLLMDEASQEAYCRKNGKQFRYEGKVFHVTAY